jgi:hypothetical protein
MRLLRFKPGHCRNGAATFKRPGLCVFGSSRKRRAVFGSHWLEVRQAPWLRKGLKGREAAAQAAEPPKSPVCGVYAANAPEFPN